jgi:hypothetical protein
VIFLSVLARKFHFIANKRAKRALETVCLSRGYEVFGDGAAAKIVAPALIFVSTHKSN